MDWPQTTTWTNDPIHQASITFLSLHYGDGDPADEHFKSISTNEKIL